MQCQGRVNTDILVSNLNSAYQIIKWLATNEEIPREVLLEALRQQSEYEARCRGETVDEHDPGGRQLLDHPDSTVYFC